MSPKTVLLTMDAAEADIVDAGLQKGWLPTLALLLKEGQGVRLAGTNEEFPGSAWPTLFTATSVAEHGRIYNRCLVPGSYRVEDVRPESIRRPPFWRFIGEAGLSSTVLSVYGAPLLEGLAGTQVAGWGTQDPYATKTTPARSIPKEMLARLDRAAPRKHAGFFRKLPETPEDFLAFRDFMLRDVHEQTHAIRVLLNETEWHFFIGGFSQTHVAGHVLWLRRDALADIYRAADDAIGRLLDQIPEGTSVFVITPNGMGPNVRVGEVMGPVLARAGLLSSGGHGGESLGATALHAARWAVKRVLPISARRALGARMPRTRAKVVSETAFVGVDWQRTRAFPLPTDGPSFIRINLVGREPSGTVEPGRDYEDVCSTIEDLASGLVDADTGLPAVKRVGRTDSLFEEDLPENFPDLVVTYNDDSQHRHLKSSALGTIEVPSEDPFTGFHRPEGFLIGRGHGIEASGSTWLSRERAALVDVGPTVLATLGISTPPVLPGRPIPAFI